MTPDVATHVERTNFLFHKFHRGKYRALRTAGAKSGGTLRHCSDGGGFFRSVCKAPGAVGMLTVRQIGEVVLYITSGIFGCARHLSFKSLSQLLFLHVQPRVSTVRRALAITQGVIPRPD